MSLYTLEELHSKTADQIRTLIEEGYRIDPIKSASKDSNKFKAVLTNDLTHFTVEIETVDDNESFKMLIDTFCNMGGGFSNSFNIPYYKVHDDIYADSEEEADREHKKWLAFKLGLGDIDGKDPVQVFADMFGNHICKCLRRGK